MVSQLARNTDEIELKTEGAVYRAQEKAEDGCLSRLPYSRIHVVLKIGRLLYTPSSGAQIRARSQVLSHEIS